MAIQHNHALPDSLLFPWDSSSWVGSDWGWSELLISGLTFRRSAFRSRVTSHGRRGSIGDCAHIVRFRNLVGGDPRLTRR